jgi:hypothetical protein
MRGHLPRVVVRDHDVTAFAEGRTFAVFYKAEKHNKKYKQKRKDGCYNLVRSRKSFDSA